MMSEKSIINDSLLNTLTQVEEYQRKKIGEAHALSRE